jgi:hypothetical protein
LDNLAATRRDLAANLADIQLIPAAYMRTFSAARHQQNDNAAFAAINAAAGNANIVKAALCAGAYPNVLRVEHPATKCVVVDAGRAGRVSDSKIIRLVLIYNLFLGNAVRIYCIITISYKTMTCC